LFERQAGEHCPVGRVVTTHADAFKATVLKVCFGRTKTPKTVETDWPQRWPAISANHSIIPATMRKWGGRAACTLVRAVVLVLGGKSSMVG